MKQMVQSGFTLIEVMIAVAAAAVVALVMSSVLGLTAKVQSSAMAVAQLEIVRLSITQALGNSVAWQNTVLQGSAKGKQPSKMDCIGSSTVTCLSGAAPIENEPFAVYDIGNELIFDATKADKGFTLQGHVCDGFAAAPAQGNDACPFRYDLRWSAVCVPPDCLDPQIRVDGILLYNPNSAANRFALDTRRLDISGFLIHPRDCTSNVQAFVMAGTHTFKVPPYRSRLVVDLWGGGGGGAGVGAAGSPGSASSFNDVVIANGGAGGMTNSAIFTPAVAPSPPVAAGGLPSGGNGFSQPGQPGTNNVGGSAPSAGLQDLIRPSLCDRQLTGGRGGDTYLWGPVMFGPFPLGAPGLHGRPFGGGGFGAQAAVGPWWNFTAWLIAAQGGGGGAYASQSFAEGDLAVDSDIRVVVGAGGAGGQGISALLFPGPWPGGNGGGGGVVIRWE